MLRHVRISCHILSWFMTWVYVMYIDVYVISGFQGILDLLHTFGLCSSRWAFAPKHPCQAFVQVEVEVNKILQKDMLAEAPLEQKTFYQLFCYAEDDWKIQAEHCVFVWSRVVIWVIWAVQSFQRCNARPTVPTTRQTMYLLQAWQQWAWIRLTFWCLNMTQVSSIKH